MIILTCFVIALLLFGITGLFLSVLPYLAAACAAAGAVQVFRREKMWRGVPRALLACLPYGLTAVLLALYPEAFFITASVLLTLMLLRSLMTYVWILTV